jgi:hypothetical protein
MSKSIIANDKADKQKLLADIDYAISLAPTSLERDLCLVARQAIEEDERDVAVVLARVIQVVSLILKVKGK